MLLKKFIRDVPDFPEKGIIFRDITPLLENNFSLAIEELAKCFSAEMLSEVDALVGVESRGFIFASALANRFKKNFILVRKKGKLPPPVIAESYQLEYGKDQMEMKQGQGKVIIIDDLIATGGTLTAAANLCQKAGYEIKDFVTLIDLTKLNNFSWQGMKVKSLIQY